MSTATVTRVRTAIIKHELAVPILYGAWIMRHREFALIRVDTSDGVVGVAYGLTRDGPIAEIVARSIAPRYVGYEVESPDEAFRSTLWTNHAVHAAGIGMRALSLVDVATWDAFARTDGRSMTRLLGGEPTSLPATAIVGYPPTTSPEEMAEQIAGLAEDGWRRFKVPISPDLDLSERRLRAARKVAPDAWLGFDINMVLRTPEAVLDFEARIRDLELGWIEDLMPPGDAGKVAQVRASSATPVAVGDEQGGSYFPEALLTAQAVDVLRVDATTDGGITQLPAVVGRATAAGVPVSPHMFPHLHARVLPGVGVTDCPIEWGVPGTGVHPMDDGLERPVIVDGRMLPLADDPGLGRLVDRAWVSKQEVLDPDGLLDGLPDEVCL